jgi:hypothetical protein
MSGSNELQRAVLIISGVVVLVGAGMMWVGYWPRRRGQTPHCRKCNYNLLGNESGRCPECGTAITRRKVVYGERPRRRTLGTVGLVVVLAGLLGFGGMTVGVLNDVDLYHYKPDSWVVGDLAWRDGQIAARAWNELARRYSSHKWNERTKRYEPNGISPAAEQKLVDVALHRQASASGGAIAEQLMNYLAYMCANGKLTKQQEELFMSRLVTIELRARPVVVVNQDVAYELVLSARGPDIWSFTLDPIELRFGESVLQKPWTGPMMDLGFLAADSLGVYSVLARQVGDHVLELRMRVKVFRSNIGTDPETREIIKKAPVKVLGPSTPELVRLIDTPVFAGPIKSSIGIRRLSDYSRSIYVKKPGVFGIEVQIGGPPVNIGFDVAARVNGKQYPLGCVALAKNMEKKFTLWTESLLEKDVGEFDLIFRSSEEAARKTVDLFEIWKGEIVIEGVEVKPAPQDG